MPADDYARLREVTKFSALPEALLICDPIGGPARIDAVHGFLWGTETPHTVPPSIEICGPLQGRLAELLYERGRTILEAMAEDELRAVEPPIPEGASRDILVVRWFFQPVAERFRSLAQALYSESRRFIPIMAENIESCVDELGEAASFTDIIAAVERLRSPLSHCIVEDIIALEKRRPDTRPVARFAQIPGLRAAVRRVVFASVECTRQRLLIRNEARLIPRRLLPEMEPALQEFLLGPQLIDLKKAVASATNLAELADIIEDAPVEEIPALSGASPSAARVTQMVREIDAGKRRLLKKLPLACGIQSTAGILVMRSAHGIVQLNEFANKLSHAEETVLRQTTRLGANRATIAAVLNGEPVEEAAIPAAARSIIHSHMKRAVQEARRVFPYNVDSTVRTNRWTGEDISGRVREDLFAWYRLALMTFRAASGLNPIPPPSSHTIAKAVEFARRHFPGSDIKLFGIPSYFVIADMVISLFEHKRRREEAEIFWKSAPLEDRTLALYLYCAHYRTPCRALPQETAEWLMDCVGQYGASVECGLNRSVMANGTSRYHFVVGSGHQIGSAAPGALVEHSHPIQDESEETFTGTGDILFSVRDLESDVEIADWAISPPHRLYHRVLHPNGGAISLYDKNIRWFMIFWVLDPRRPKLNAQFRHDMRDLHAWAKSNNIIITFVPADYDDVLHRRTDRLEALASGKRRSS